MSKNTKRTNDRAGTHAPIERWLHAEVVPTYDAMKENPKRGLSAKSVFAEARARVRLMPKANHRLQQPSDRR
jgi:hypothetical protein